MLRGVGLGLVEVVCVFWFSGISMALWYPVAIGLRR